MPPVRPTSNVGVRICEPIRLAACARIAGIALCVAELPRSSSHCPTYSPGIAAAAARKRRLGRPAAVLLALVAIEEVEHVPALVLRARGDHRLQRRVGVGARGTRGPGTRAAPCPCARSRARASAACATVIVATDRALEVAVLDERDRCHSGCPSDEPLLRNPVGATPASPTAPVTLSDAARPRSSRRR